MNCIQQWLTHQYLPNHTNHGNKTDMAQNSILTTNTLHQLTNSLQEDHRLDISHCSSHLNQTNIGLVASIVNRQIGNFLNPALSIKRRIQQPT